MSLSFNISIYQDINSIFKDLRVRKSTHIFLKLTFKYKRCSTKKHHFILYLKTLSYMIMLKDITLYYVNKYYLILY